MKGILRLGVLTVSVALLGGAAGSSLAQNLLPNGGFELASQDKPGRPASWNFAQKYTEGKIEWVTDLVHSGERAVKLEAVRYAPPEDASGYGAISCGSDWFEAPAANATIEVSAWIKAKEVISPGSYYMLRFTLYVYDETKRKKMVHWDIACVEGSFDWKQFSSKMIVPEGAGYMRVACQLTACTGTAWFDDVSVQVARPALTVEGVLDSISVTDQPIVIPQPWQVKYGPGRLPLDAAVIVPAKGDSRATNAAQKMFEDLGVPCKIAAAADSEGADSALLMLGDSSVQTVAEKLGAAFPDVGWADLGDQGYFLSVEEAENRGVVRVGANTEVGRFYALQSLKQLLEEEDGRIVLREAEMVDRPTLSRRGIAMGVQWFRQKAQAVARLAALKGNFIVNQGSFMGGKFGGNYATRWREPLTDGEKQTLRDYLHLCRENFIEVALSLSPRGEPPTQYSSDTDIALVVDKMSALYGLGFRNLGMNFDDLRNIGQERLIVPEDIETFGGDMGRAHLHFVGEVYRRVKALHPDVSFRILPMWYSGFTSLGEKGKEYLKTVGQLAPEIGFVVCATDEANIAEFAKLTGRQPLTWDNYLAAWGRTGGTIFVPAPAPPKTLRDDRVEGYIFLPATPATEDGAGTSWLTAADYLWSPERYDAERSFELAVIRGLGGAEGVAAFKQYHEFMSELRDQSPPAGEEVRAEWQRKTLKALVAWKGRLEAVLPERLLARIAQEMDEQSERVKAAGGIK